MIKKAVLMVLLYHFTAITITSCTCPDDVLPFYDFKTVKLSYPLGTEVYDSSFFVIEIAMDSIDFLASETKFNGLGGLISSAQATSCPDDGEDGRKYEIVNVEIVSNQDWDEVHLAGSSLKDLAYYGNWDSQAQKYTYEEPFSEKLKHKFWTNVFVHFNSHMILKFPRPSKSPDQILTIKFTKANGEVVKVDSEEIRWL
ncbi:hypothetical protein GCM10009122_48580 [Fulvivirga kasyanovii]|uniref:DUF5017 domain-containing protein n=1 Tax=Fulvivirga kasyanovii TaxID=396812 RepID=A0ABW9RZK2_9BACT|nr:hypothetical protein [Fulvivirga kasyanovii]MTI28713.1 hypothetical protein [Fulvivirga kasyanovii]